ncbi:chalcone isomerase family protein [Waddlia chondrophila]|uniref:Chalcone isomerase domain-containing protein n=1 Tax=Waddlia chondrophila (strain ATCC VR-1470 / WSU 86-1044) TaxID=716544 RepID=D6YWV0_WADCW|nr:chalcone isomerase family protein [Waddlia chondrophila]ADI38611.1 conserved hypothetical protein [Waddlia chondrophila WSU 86-1044]
MNYCRLATYGFTTLIGAFILINSANAAITDKSTGESFPDTETVKFNEKNHRLEATGISTRKKFFVKVYSVAHYMEDPQKGEGNAAFDAILNSDKPKQLFLKWVRSVSGKKVQDGYKESFDKVANREQRRDLQVDIDKYMSFFSRGVSEGDTHQLSWLPDGTIEVVINGNQVGIISNRDFAKTLWSIWFGPKSVVNRNDLISRIR